MAMSLLRVRQGMLIAGAIGIVGPATSSAHVIDSASSQVRDKAYGAVSMPAVGAKLVTVDRQARELAVLSPVSFAEAAVPAALSSELTVSRREANAESTSGPRTASTVASTLALILFFFLRRVK